MTIEEAGYAHSMGSAYADFAEKKGGFLEPCKLADLIVRHDPFSARPKQLVDLTIDLTMLSGKIVHSI